MDLQEFLDEWNNQSDTVLVHTSGSTGKPKAMRVEKHRMEASARLTCDFLGLKPGDTALLCMPLDYIAGKMVVVRSIVRDLQLVSIKPSGHPLAGIDTPPTFAAMVPMQVYNSLQTEHERTMLKAVKHLIIGGGAVDKLLETELRNFPNAVWSTYGMTETLSHIAMRRISGSGADSWYTPLDGVNVSLDTDDCLVINAPAVCPSVLHTNDIAELHADGHRFRILGRKDNVICSGGIKIMMEDVEDALRRHLSMPFIITKRVDARLGEAVVILFEGTDAMIDTIKEVCLRVLPKYWRPKNYIPINQIPATETGKPARAKARRIASGAHAGGRLEQ